MEVSESVRRFLSKSLLGLNWGARVEQFQQTDLLTALGVQPTKSMPPSIYFTARLSVISLSNRFQLSVYRSYTDCVHSSLRISCFWCKRDGLPRAGCQDTETKSMYVYFLGSCDPAKFTSSVAFYRFCGTSCIKTSSPPSKDRLLSSSASGSPARSPSHGGPARAPPHTEARTPRPARLEAPAPPAPQAAV